MPSNEVASEITEFVPRVGVQAAVTIRDPLGELTKEHAKSGAPTAIPPSTTMPIVHARTAASGLGLARYLGPNVGSEGWRNSLLLWSKRREVDMAALRTIAVGYDGSSDSAAAVSWAAELASRSRCPTTHRARRWASRRGRLLAASRRICCAEHRVFSWHEARSRGMAHPRWGPLFGAAAGGESADLGGPPRGGQQGRRKALGNAAR